MLLTRPEHWLFSVKALLAGLLALAVAFWFDLPRPYWALATVYVASQPLSGATVSKAFYRVIGTLAGAAMAVLLVPNLVNAPPVLALAIAAWSGLCLYVSILDRTPRGYAFMLAGYTTAIIGFPAVDAPERIFDLAVARGEEILIGISSAALVSSLVFPRSVAPVVAERVELWLADARIAARDALRPSEAAAGRTHWLRLAGDTAQIETLATHLPFEAAFDRRALALVRQLAPRMLMTLPEISALRDVAAELDALGGPSPSAAGLIARMEDALERTDQHAFAELATWLDTAVAAVAPLGCWRDVLELNLAVRLLDLAQLLADCTRIATALAEDAPGRAGPLSFPIEARAARRRHNERGRAALAGATLFLALTLCCAFWILTSWPEGAAAAMMTAVAASLFATSDDPAPSIARFAAWSAVAVALSGVYVFFILPQVHSFETLALSLSPALLLFGLLIAEPRTFVPGVALGILTPSAMALQPAFDANAEAFLNSGLAMVAGMAIAAATTAILHRADATWRAAGFVHANETALAEVADPRKESNAMGAMFDRLSLLAPLIDAAREPLPDALRQLRAGLNLVDARKSRDALPERARRRLDAALLRLQRAFGRHAPLNDDVLAALDGAMRALRPGEAADRSALLALAGLRRCLFPGVAPAPLKLSEPSS
ncbi:MAG: FUSC family protein [Methylocystis sp.]|uniref:FUSC family protein n=1 Tax=Methylocystis sp. TaxID=1911079 RepID=UPI003DA400C2